MSMMNGMIRLSKTRSSVLGLHVICWCLYIAYEVGVVYYSAQKLAPFVNYLLLYPVNIGLFYAQLYLLNRFFYQKRQAYVSAVVYTLLQFALFLGLKWLIDVYLAPSSYTLVEKFTFARKFLALDLIRGFNFCLLALFYWVAGNAARLRRKSAEAETRYAQARNAFLQQQLNPHLLFNALNFIYSTVYKTSQDGARCLMLLSDLMRYGLDCTGEDGRTGLGAEVEQVRKLIAINSFRFDQPLRVDIDLPEDANDIRIIPLLLLTLTENVFKHGVVTDERFPAVVHLTISASNRLTLLTKNLKKPKSAIAGKQGLGLDNIRTRLMYSYNGKHSLEITDRDKDFELLLTIDL